MSQSLSFAYFGTPAVAAKTLERLIEAGFVPALVVTSPDAPKGRGLVLTPSETKAAARTHDIPTLTPEKLDEKVISMIGSYDCDYAVVVAYGKIFPQALIDSFPKGAINVHYSLLPKYRGATPMEAALLAGDTLTGVSIQQMVLALDAGDILAQEAMPIEPEETARELRARLVETGANLLIETLPRFERSEITSIPQNHALATRAHKFKKEDGELHPPIGGQASPQQHLESWRKYRAYADTIGTYFFKDSARYKITRASLKGGQFIVERVIPEGKAETDWRG